MTDVQYLNLATRASGTDVIFGGSFLLSPLLHPDKRFALDLFALLVSKSNIIHFTFYF